MTQRPKRNMLVIELTREMHLDIKVNAHVRNMSMKDMIIMVMGNWLRKEKERNSVTVPDSTVTD